jgi:hypothetical protein
MNKEEQNLRDEFESLLNDDEMFKDQWGNDTDKGYSEESFKEWKEECVASCLECKKPFIQERDIQLCDRCVKLFDLDRLWKMHDSNKIDALDFNERKSIREKYRKVKR